MQELFCILTTPPGGIGHRLSMSGIVGASAYIPAIRIHPAERDICGEPERSRWAGRARARPPHATHR